MFVYSLALFPSFIPFLFQLLYFLGFSFALHLFCFHSLCIPFAFIRFASLWFSFALHLSCFHSLCDVAPSFGFLRRLASLCTLFCFHSLCIPFAFIRFASLLLSFASHPFCFHSLCTLFWLSFALRPLLAFIRFAPLWFSFALHPRLAFIRIAPSFGFHSLCIPSFGFFTHAFDQKTLWGYLLLLSLLAFHAGVPNTPSPQTLSPKP